MIFLADTVVINYLISNKTTGRKNDYKESHKPSANFILIDYFDWLDYIIKADNPKSTVSSLNNFKELKSDCKTLITLLSRPLTADSFNKILDEGLIENKKGTKKYTKIKLLCDGYRLFISEMLALQRFYLDKYEYNNTNHPKLLIPFSFGLNRLCSKHYYIKDYLNEFGMVETSITETPLPDSCRRTSIDLGLRLYTYDKLITPPPYDLPKEWFISQSFDEESAGVIKKVPYLNQCYSQYCYSGYSKNIWNKEQKLLSPFDIEDDEDELQFSEILTEPNILNKNCVFLLNYPPELSKCINPNHLPNQQPTQ